MNWIILEKCIRPKGSIVVFHDPQQDIFGANVRSPGHYLPLDEDFKQLGVLNINMRNSKRIVRWLQQKNELNVLQAHDESPDGNVSPEDIYQPDGSAGRLTIEELVRQLLGGQKKLKPEQICILSLSSQASTTLKEVHALADVRLTDNPFGREGMILSTSARKFKGLESDVVIVIDVDAILGDDLKTNLLVACSRAKHLLYLFRRIRR